MTNDVPSQTLVAAFREPRELVLERRALPPLAPGEALLQVEACGICGSDLHAYDSSWMQPGEVPGHETAGTVIARADDEARIEVGDRIAIHPLIPCGNCRFCKDGRDNVCAEMRSARGGYSSHMVLPAGTREFILPPTMPSAVGAMLEPLAVAVRAVDLAPAVLNEPCVVTGLGAIGQCAVRVLIARGFTDVIAVDVVEEKLEYARRAGASTINAAQVDVAAELAARYGAGNHKGYDYANVPLVIDCSGAPKVISDAVRSYLLPGGTLVVAALFEVDLSLDINPLVRKEITMQGSYSANSAAVASAFDLLSSGRVELGDLVSEIIPLAEVDEAFRDSARRARSVKLVLSAQLEPRVDDKPTQPQEGALR